ncbi:MULTISPECIES: HAMP domain-containing sensor histidine kinase [unclassified Thauera]|uniref:sensor histidine kinase n=1 Tax=unclassified Thauera TaxID=2609274 RepID=UPI0002CEFCBF|nr:MULTISPECIES: HAMP domain-containing sensor histidine kinase [unclassified Thauera]ENO92024.1 histidine kinase [Thauera sp. 28]WBL64858.1 HAMP domain-containing histidine kinase [Thauera sp. WB-2]HAG75638.1 sensor histidine kinase [Thauera sp.]HAY08666.1 sensor histidine kinase [Thauera sp.]HNR59702.1 HAMP domain-containing sensor histidine kinase [Thauera sp.]
MLPATFSAFELQPVPDGASTILRLLAAAAPNWPEVALVAARDPALSLALLIARPLAAGELDGGINSALRRRLEDIGTDLLRAWLLGLGHLGNGNAEAGTKALLRAECAMHLAIESGYPRPDEAYLGGLWRGLSRPGSCRDGRRPPYHSLMRDCGLPASLADGLELAGLADERATGAHPLLALLSAADLLTADDWEAHIARVSGLAGLPAEAVLSLRTDVGYIVSGHAVYPPAGSPLQTTPHPPARLSDDPYRSAGMLGLLTAAFVDLDTAAIKARLQLACPLFGLHTPPVLLGVDGDGLLRPLLEADCGSTEALIAELSLRLEDEASCIALSTRSELPTSFIPAGGAPGRSVADWQIARWLGQHGFHCLPLSSGHDAAVALIPAPSENALDSELRWRYAALLGAAARALRNVARQRNEIAAREAMLQQRFREHVRKIAHEAANPLTVLKSRLGMLVQQRPEDAPLQDEMSLLNAELDRIDNLLRSAAELPTDTAEPRYCRVPELLLDMRTLYGEPLFGSRDLQLELRAARDVPTAAIPASALKQVLLNLLRNASEALQPGQRLVISVFPQVNVDGRNCLEIRFVDNGPGLPTDRLDDLLSARPSAKGGNHQGVGLAVVRDILAQWSATLLCRSQAGTGTSFQIFVPLEQTA